VTIPNFLPVNHTNTAFLRSMLGNGKKPENKYYMKIPPQKHFCECKRDINKEKSVNFKRVF